MSLHKYTEMLLLLKKNKYKKIYHGYVSLILCFLLYKKKINTSIVKRKYLVVFGTY